MTENLKAFIARNETEQREFLEYYNAGSALYNFGEKGLSLDYDENSWSGRVGILLRLGILLILIGITGKFLVGLIVYVGIHLLIEKVGGKIRDTYQEKLDKIQIECQNSLDQFIELNYKENGIRWGTKGDEVRFAQDLVVRGSSFEAGVHSDILQMHIYCLKNLEKKFWKKRRVDEGIDMKKNIASLEFNRNFQIFLPQEQEREGMKFLSPARQIEMIKSTAFDGFRSIHIEEGRLYGIMKDSYNPPNRRIDVYKYQPIGKYFSDVEEYCRNMRTRADNVQNSYIQIANIITK